MKEPSPAHILIVDDEAAMRQGLVEFLQSDGFRTSACADVQAAVKLLDQKAFDLVITDLVMKQQDGMNLLEWIRANRPEMPVVMMTGHSSVQTAVEAMRLGAIDYLAKPFQLNDVRHTIGRALKTAGLERENQQLRRQLDAVRPNSPLIGRSSAMRVMMNLVHQIADSDVPVLITGETGTGKELLAREIHRNSPRAGGPFLSVNCAALPDTLLESELFGHVRGAFTGAAESREGLFQAAHGGTLFLDEIGDISLNAQGRLLRTLQDGEIRRIGENVARHVNVRIVAATNQPLADRIRRREFREDLYYRLNVVTLSPPPLRERREDVPLLAAHFLDKHRHDRGLSALRIEPEVVAVLQRYDWPGNVRELENVMRRAAALTVGAVVRIEDLPAQVLRPAVDGAPCSQSLDDVERIHILNVLRESQGNISRAARVLNISRPTLRAKIEKYGVDSAQFRGESR